MVSISIEDRVLGQPQRKVVSYLAPDISRPVAKFAATLRGN